MLHHFAPVNDLDQRADEYIIKALKDVKVCDPAIGSGAFPMGILHEMFRLIEFFEDRDTLYSIWDIDEWDAARFKESIIQNSIYGVDIEKGAVDIARLRFWLSIIIDEKEPKPLPNLDYKIVVGDSLLSKFDGHIVEIDWNIKVDKTLKSEVGVAVAKLAQRIKDGLQLIANKQKDFFQTEVDNKDGLLAEIRKLKIELLLDQLRYNKGRYIDTHPLKGGFAPTAKEKKLNLDRELAIKKFDDLQVSLQDLLKHPNKPFNHFDWNLDFPEVLNPLIRGENRGFDIIIANPPYMRVQEITKSLPEDKDALEAKYDNARMSYDLANLFFELAINLSHKRSTNCFIFPHKFFNAASAEVFRDYLWKGKYVDKIVHFGANMVFNEADTYTCITHFSPVANEGFDLIKLDFGENWARALTKLEFNFVSYEDILNASKLYGSNQWIFFKGEVGYSAFSKIYGDRPPKIRLSEKFEDIFQGIATSNDKLYFLRVTHEDAKFYYGVIELNNEAIHVEKKYFKPMLKGKDVHRYAPLSTDLYVFFPYDVEDGIAPIVELDSLKKNYPMTYKYVKAYEKDFKDRERGKARTMDYWYAYIYPKNLTKFEQLKLSSMEICSKHPNVTLNNSNFYHNTKVYSWVKKEEVKESYEYFLAVANSSVLWWFLKNTGDTLQGDARTLKTNYLNPFPLPKVVSKDIDNLFKKRVEQIIKLKASGKETEQYEKAIDVLVCKLYELTYEEAKEVDPKIELNKSEYNSLKLQ
jgi:adenine-specific DNA-methyltransferase